jgi:adenylate kinase
MVGCPGCGKGTQGAVLGQLPNVRHLAMGDIFRGLDKASEIGREFLSYSSKGLLVPDELTIRVFLHHLDVQVAAGKIIPNYHTLLLDGIPRTPNQMALLADAIEVKRVVHLVIDDRDALIARLMGRAKKSYRHDDGDRCVIENRIDVYERETAPVLDAYPKKLVARVNADQHPLAVLRDIAGVLMDVIPAKI